MPFQFETPIRVLAIAPYESMKISLTHAAEHFPELSLDVYTGDLEEGVNIVKGRDSTRYDVILSRGGTNPMHFRVYVDDQALGEYAGDGIVVATPTGSTAYSLSAGGPILDPATRMIVLTPVCAHIIGSRSIVISHRSIVKIVIDPEYTGTQSVSFDGGEAIAVKPGDHIVISESELTAPLIELERMSFLERLRRKMQMI